MKQYTLETLIAETKDNEQYHKQYRITSDDVEKVNKIISRFWQRSLPERDYVSAGDVVEIRMRDVIYDTGHIERIDGLGIALLCELPWTPFYYPEADYFSTSGGAWHHCPVKELSLIGIADKLIKVWGQKGENKPAGVIQFRINVKKWFVTINR